MNYLPADLHRQRLYVSSNTISARITERAYAKMLEAIVISNDFPIIIGSQFVTPSGDNHWDDIVTILDFYSDSKDQHIKIGYGNQTEIMTKELFLKRLKRLKYMLFIQPWPDGQGFYLPTICSHSIVNQIQRKH